VYEFGTIGLGLLSMWPMLGLLSMWSAARLNNLPEPCLLVS
jgi:hypothetical protein